jgi:hypothetical protein
MEGADGVPDATVLEAEAALSVFPVTEAFAVRMSPVARVSPETDQAPYPLTVAVPSSEVDAL